LKHADGKELKTGIWLFASTREHSRLWVHPLQVEFPQTAKANTCQIELEYQDSLYI
jgi:hypothetical protein